ncbi:helix-turn-helix domain-containing protein [Stackebrandtia albiflava]|uniref:helix-turn-helix domain-containing protein n=1 Tax=Stackebrandtia albiflava TaxID=406432 RepID=UPI001B86792C
MSQARIAELLGTTQSAVARMEAAGTDPRWSTLHRYATAVGSEMSITLAPPTTLDGVAHDIASADSADERLRHVIQFLDDLRDVPAVQRPAALSEEPVTTGDPRWDALLAGVAEYACRRHGMSMPGWPSAPGRFLRRFWFVIEDVLGREVPGLAAMAYTTPVQELAARGVFLDRHSLESV